MSRRILIDTGRCRHDAAIMGLDGTPDRTELEGLEISREYEPGVGDLLHIIGGGAEVTLRGEQQLIQLQWCIKQLLDYPTAPGRATDEWIKQAPTPEILRAVQFKRVSA